MATIEREALSAAVRRRLRDAPVVMMLGPRQCGKTTLARDIAGDRAVIFDLEVPADRERMTDAMTTLAPLKGLVVVDEAQLAPAVFPVLRVLADRKPLPARFLLLGSVAPELARGVAETLAGRVSLLPISGFDLTEVGADAFRRLWLRGGFPRSFLARSHEVSHQWRNDFVQTFLERDLGRFGFAVAPLAMRRLWTMVAHHHGQILNSSELGRSLGEAHTTVRRHLEILAGAYVVRLLPPWFENLGKRQVKSPKVYVRDSGILHALLGVGTFRDLERHPKIGASWEGFVIEQILRMTGDREAYFWHTQAGAELDLLLFVGGKRFGFEVKYGDVPRIGKSLRVALDDLRLDRAFVVYPGADSFALDARCEAVAIGDLTERVRRLLPGRR